MLSAFRKIQSTVRPNHPWVVFFHCVLFTLALDMQVAFDIAQYIYY